ncbi:MAG: hypothetical protein KDA64_16960 [Rhodospirillaceae bacterium]|nr:hypothetical protein [Rhodospirillaceae bacterium]
MTKLVFDKSTGKLTGFGKSWNATSGTSSINPLANKTYTAPAHALMTGTKKTVSGVPSSKTYDKDSYTDDNGFSWFLWIGQGNLGIHPEGGAAGTLGCIGITDGDTRPLFDEIKAVMHESIEVEVKGEVGRKDVKALPEPTQTLITNPAGTPPVWQNGTLQQMNNLYDWFTCKW